MRMRWAVYGITAVIFLTPAVVAQVVQPPQEGDATYRPYSGQPGKDVVWVPTPQPLVNAMLKTARVGANDIVYDLGSGDGRTVITAARDFGARAYGVEFNPDMVALAKRNAQRAGVTGRVSFIQGDLFKTDFSKATVLTLYLLPDINMRLRERVLAMRPGTRVVSHAFDFGDWQPDQTISEEERTAYYWVVPARVAGRYTLARGQGNEQLTLSQTYQMLKGSVAGSKAPVGISSGRVRGRDIMLTLADGTRLNGTVGDNGTISGKGWTATRG